MNQRHPRRPAIWIGSYVAYGLMLGVSFCRLAFALPSDISLSQLYHSQWTVQHGAPSGIHTIVQTRDGYIWLLAKHRLFRFDGAEFERVERIHGVLLPTEPIYAIGQTPDGGLWLSYQYGGVTLVVDGTVRTYTVNDGLPPNTLSALIKDASGRLWAASTRGLLRLQGEQWVWADETGIPRTGVFDIAIDRQATLWILSIGGLHYLRRDEQRAETALQFPTSNTKAYLKTFTDGQAWLVHAGMGLAQLHTPAPGASFELRWRKRGFESDHSLPSVLIDRDSTLWIADAGIVTRIPLTDAADESARPPQTKRLAGDFVGPIFEDREGNVWVTSNAGLDKFRSTAFVPVLTEFSFSSDAALAASNDDSLWVGSFEGRLHRLAAGVVRESLPNPVFPLNAMHVDHAGTLWVAGGSGRIYHRRGDRWIEWRPRGNIDIDAVQAFTSQPDGTIWVSIPRVGVYSVIDNRWTLWGGLEQLPREPATALAVDASGRLWVGYTSNRIAVVDQDQVVVHDANDGISTGAVHAITARGRNIWIGGEHGLNWFDGRRFHNVRGAPDHSFGIVTGIVEKAHGDLWLNTTEGVVLILAAEQRSVAAGRPVQFRLYNHLDGAPGASGFIRPVPSAVESTDGRVWFSTSNGVITAAPRWPAPNPIVPHVDIKSLTADGTRIDAPSANSPLQLPSNPHVLQIAYTALSYSIPERVHFRYRLEGSDMGWQDVGMRREAYFTGLPPGNYRFQVIASNDSGIWNETGASVEFVIPPTFLQSGKFIVLCVVLGSAVLWLLFMLRMRQVKAQLQSRAEERLLERERIARELHDTFLQGVQGLMLRFQSATERIPEGEPARNLMEEALDRADRVLAEGRDKVAELRASNNLKLTEALTMTGNELSRDYGVSFQARIEGATRRLNPLVQEEVYRMGAEALTNAFRHAHATHISATVVFGRRRFEMRVVDDGCGFDPAHEKPGRWGLKGMRERAERIHGKIFVSSQPGAGTTVELHLPAKLAYRKAAGSRRSWRKLLGTTSLEEPA
jgi:signal transduction histidine kinase/ligand-binding sensor domain-containing protein